MSATKTILITGGAGFIGSHLVRLLVNKYPTYHIVNLDALTYAGNLENLKDVQGKANYSFEKADISMSKLSKEERLSVGITPGMIRLSVGLEHIDDLIRDLAQALENSKTIVVTQMESSLVEQ